MSLISVEEYLNLSGASTYVPEPTYNILCDAISLVVENYCDRPLEKKTRTEFYKCTGTNKLALRVRPVWSVVSLYYDEGGYYGKATGAFPTETLFLEGDDFVMDYANTDNGFISKTGIVYKIKGVWPEIIKSADPFKISRDLAPSFGNIKITYVGGFDPIPADIKLACAQLITKARRDMKYGAPIEKERLGDHAYTLADSALRSNEIGGVRQILSQYKETSW